MTVQLGVRNKTRALNYNGLRFDRHLGRELGRRSMSCRHCQVNGSQDPYWASSADQVDILGLMASNVCERRRTG